MAHLHGDRAFGHGGGTSNQNLITGLDRDSADSSSSTEVRLLPWLLQRCLSAPIALLSAWQPHCCYFCDGRCCAPTVCMGNPSVCERPCVSWQVAGGTTRISADLEPFNENPELEARLRESEIAPPLPALGLENAPPVSTPAQHPISAPLNFEGIVSLRQLDNRRSARERQGGLSPMQQLILAKVCSGVGV